MAKKKKGKKKRTDDSAKPNKAEIRAYHKENGWRATVSHFGIAPKDLSPIVMGGKGKKAAKKKKPPKKVSKTGKKTSKKKGQKTTKGKSVDAPYGLKKDGTPKKPPGRKKGKKATKKTAAPKKKSKKTVTKRKASKTQAARFEMEGVLDYLLDYRKKNQKPAHMVTLDNVIIDLTSNVRGV